MNILKIMNMVLIIIICTYIGINKSQKYSIRVNKLRNLKRRI